ncbi:MAG: Verru Chthon cassette protein, partial [Verrucomicrobiaceae bacterium]|nr:Verru Chthon cassette protein [Verrucomicrobiaceae bacterium]
MTNTRIIRKREQGVALIIVILLLTLMVGLMLAMFDMSDSQLRSARSYSQGQQARQLADVAVSAVISQLRQGTAQDATTDGMEAWTSQPGLVRKYTQGGALLRAYKLYSSAQMVVPSTAASTLMTDVAPANWRSHPERYADMNRPVFSPANNGAAGLRFPIIDPRAMTGGADGVGGFSYSATTTGGKVIDGVVTGGGDAQRLPMPVEWLYVLKDGSLGALDDAGHFSGASTPAVDNPIVGRIAFWTDDESSKVNINTASEPTAWALPTFFSETDAAYARYQPAHGEFQRYPGHPATTALSPVLFPGRVLSVLDKDDIYNLVPKIGPGGTRSATVAYNDPLVKPVALNSFRGEHLYANLDELLLKDNRQPNTLGSVPLTEEGVHRKNFFLTAHSRAPELNPFGQPKIAMWPLSYRGAAYQTSFDQLIAWCSTLRPGGTPRQYMFQRGWADSPTADLQRPENIAMLNYLLTSLGKPMPGFAPDALHNFAAKYGDDLPQLVAEFFDYIRGTNLHDSNLIKPGDKIIPDNTTQNFMLGYASSSARAVNFKTFTDPRFFAADPDADNPDADGLTELLGYPGHGQVTPTRMTVNGKDYQGIARFPTISEAGLHFICSADNTDDTSNPYEERYPDIGKPGGARAPMLSTAGLASPQPTDYWYSNFPPRPSPNPANNEKPNTALYPLTGGYPYGPDKKHPGYLKKYWNHQLSERTPLKPGIRRVQARFLVEFFIPAAGYTIIEPDISVKVSGLSKFKVGGKQLFPRDAEVIRSGRRATHPGSDQ